MNELDIRMEDFTGEFANVAEHIGLEAAKALIEYCPGVKVHIPTKGSLLKARRNERIYAEYTDKKNPLTERELAKKYDMSDENIRRIIRQERDKSSKPACDLDKMLQGEDDGGTQ